MKNLIAFFIRRSKIVNFLMLLILVAGFNSLMSTNKQTFPSVDFGIALIQTFQQGATPKEIEINITKKIEEKLKQINGIDSYSSGSYENYSSIAMYFKQGADYDKTLNDIQKAIDQIGDFPQDVDPPTVLEVNNAIIPVIEVGISGTASYAEKRNITRILEQKIRQLKGIGNIEKYGYLNREVHIKVDPQKANQAYVSLGSVMAAIQQQNMQLGAGDILASEEKRVKFDSQFKTTMDVKNVIIRSGFEGNNIKVSDIAIIEDTFEEPDLLYRTNGKEIINLVVFKSEETDIVTMSKVIAEEVQKFQSALPNNIQVDIINNYSKEVNNLIKVVKNNAVLGLVLVLIILFVILNFKVAFWTALGIPVSVLFAFLFMPLFDVQINIITLMTFIIVLGLLVDDAIVVSENIYSYREKGLAPQEASLKGAIEVMWPVTATIFTTIIAFSPLFAMNGVMGEFMKQMPIVITLVLIGSLIESLFFLPSHLAHAKIKKRKKIRFNPLSWMANKYEKWVYYTIKYHWVTVITFIVMLVFSVFLLKSMRFVLFDSSEGEFAYIKFQMEAGTSLATTAEMSKKFEPILNPYVGNEIVSYKTTIGKEKATVEETRGGNSQLESFGNILIFMKTELERERTSIEIVNEIEAKVNRVTGFKKVEVGSVAEGPPVGRAVTMTFVSDNDEKRNGITKKLKTFLAEQPSVSKIEDTQGIGKKVVTVRINQAEAAKLNLNTRALSKLIQTIYSGTVVTTLTTSEEAIDFRLMVDDKSRSTLDTLTNIKMFNDLGKLVPIKSAISLSETDDVVKISHYNGTRSITVYANNDNDQITPTELNKKIKDYIMPLVENDIDLELVVGGQEKNTQESLRSLYVAMIFALFGIYFILVILFNSFSQPFLVMSAIPFTFSGIVFTFFLHNLDFGFMAMIGLIGLTGIVVNDALIMISMLNTCRDNIGTDISSLATAAKRRFRPILLTTLTTSAGLFPAAYGFGGMSEWLQPMILSIAWGLVFATIITLILVPAIYKIQLNIFWNKKG
ncbi:hypothetical protein DID76_01390 [Candidatus Marinamargulisbacteria bacterium SCGC AG-414-C22]|nr:hypothetical protein DID76_01390 [Candidatus Marinamargulisbacteria bacterium SCGC AG-414-C22]